MKFNQVNKEQIEQASEAIETIHKLKAALSEQRLANKIFKNHFFEQNLAFVKITNNAN